MRDRGDLAGGPPDDHDDDHGDLHPLELALRYGMRYSGLRDVELDSRLLLYVPLELCEQELVVPLSVDDDLLTVATVTADPDLQLVIDRFPKLELELVVAPAERVAELLDDIEVMH